MKSEKKILIAFVLNAVFSVFEFAGGILTGSVALASDAVHDAGDAVSIGISYFLERKSRQQPDETYTYGYARYSIIGSVITALILVFGSVAVTCKAITRIIEPAEIHYNGMLFFAVVGVCVNLGAVWFSHGGESLNQKVVNLHMLEDALGWIVVLAGAVVMRFTGFVYMDPILSIGVAGIIFVSAAARLKEAVQILLEKAPRGIEIREIKRCVTKIDGVLDVHHVHVWSMDGQNNYATMHVVTNTDFQKIKEGIREELLKHGIDHVTLEPETEGACCRKSLKNDG